MTNTIFMNRKLTKFLLNLISSLASVFLALLLSSILILITGKDPVLTYRSLINGAFGSTSKALDTLSKTSPLIFTGLSVAIGFTGGTFNIGAEGQFLVGAFFAGLLGIILPPGLSSFIVIPLLIMAAIIGGILAALIPALLKTFRGSSEVITTIMMNYFFLYLISSIVNGPFRKPTDLFAALPPIIANGRLPILFPNLSGGFTASIFIAITFAILMYIVLFRTVIGYEIRVVGLNADGGAFAGIHIKKTMLVSFLISGALAGIGGGLEVLGNYHQFLDGFTIGYGFAGISIALLARKNPIGVIFAALFFGTLQNGAIEAQIVADVSKQTIDSVQGFVVVFIAGELGLRYLVSFFKDKLRRNKL